MSKFYFAKISCPKDFIPYHVFSKFLINFQNQKSFSARLKNIPNRLREATIGDLVFLQLGGDSSNKKKFLSDVNGFNSNTFNNGIYYVGKISEISDKDNEFKAYYFPFEKPITKLDLYIYPQFIDNLGCITKGIPNQAGLYEMKESTAFSFMEYLLLNNISGTAKDLLKEFPTEKHLESAAREFYDENDTLLSHISSSAIKNIISPVKACINYPKVKDAFELERFVRDIERAKLMLDTNVIYRFSSILQTKPFSILTGLSGSGKTKLAEAFSLWICKKDKQTCMVSVGADWTNREPLLGFPNALDKGQYVKPDSGVLDLLINAKNDPSNPYFLILDEMNMSHVERYFADFLSAMESVSGEIALRPDTVDWEGCDVPAKIRLPKNLFIIGTVNIDETTYMFSPKVLDRANVIEFRVSENEMDNYFKQPTELNLNSLKGAGASMAESFVAKSYEKGLMATALDAELMPFFINLQAVGAEFGYRTASEISRFVKICEDMKGGTMSRDEIVDAAIIQKLLPKLHGSRSKIEKVLDVLIKLCMDGESIKYTLSHEKLTRMKKRVIADGFTSFAEA